MSINRSLYSNLKPRVVITHVEPKQEWFYGDDVPLFWDQISLRKLRMKTLRQNRELGMINQKEFEELQTQYKNSIK